MKKPITIVIILAVAMAVVAIGVQIREGGFDRADEAKTQADIDRQVDMLKKQNPEAFEGAEGEAVEAKYRQKIEEQLHVGDLLKKKAEEMGQKATQAEVDAAISQVRAAYASEADFNKALKSRDMSLADYQISIGNQITSSKLMAAITKDLVVTDAQAREYYDANKSKYVNPDDKSKTRPFKSVVAEIKSLLLSQKQSKKYADFMESLEAK